MTYRADRDQRDLRSEDVDDMHLLVSPEARRKGVQLVWRCQIPHDIPVPASTVRQVLLNLVLNACQASPRDGWTSVAITTDQVRLRTGREDMGQDFRYGPPRYCHGNAVLPAPIGEGGGLGLWMTNRLVRECGGEVSVETGVQGWGPVDGQNPAGERADSAEECVMSLENRTLALVEDDPIMGESLVQRLEIEGATVHWWRSADAARSRAGFDAPTR